MERILSDARKEADSIVAEAEAKAAKLRAEAKARAETLESETKTETAARRKSILEKREAAARLDGAKLLLGEKRKVIDAIYDEAHSRLLELSKEESVKLIKMLLESYAEDGDELYFAENFPYAEEVALLPVIAAKKLKISAERLPLDGGLRLKGEKSDKDLSYGAVLAADREEYQAELAHELFK